jgi:hypothetical protein
MKAAALANISDSIGDYHVISLCGAGRRRWRSVTARHRRRGGIGIDKTRRLASARDGGSSLPLAQTFNHGGVRIRRARDAPRAPSAAVATAYRIGGNVVARRRMLCNVGAWRGRTLVQNARRAQPKSLTRSKTCGGGHGRNGESACLTSQHRARGGGGKTWRRRQRMSA